MDRITEVLLLKSLDGLSERAVATAQNIANAQTNGYRPLRVDFESLLAKAAPKGADAVRAVVPKLSQALPGADLRLDLELASASQTAARYGALADLLGRALQIQTLAVTGSK